MTAVALTRHSLANGISGTKSERTTEQKRNYNTGMSPLLVGHQVTDAQTIEENLRDAAYH
jgi:hypothetical protein